MALTQLGSMSETNISLLHLAAMGRSVDMLRLVCESWKEADLDSTAYVEHGVLDGYLTACLPPETRLPNTYTTRIEPSGQRYSWQRPSRVPRWLSCCLISGQMLTQGGLTA